MADNRCKSEAACCKPPALVLPGQPAKAAPVVDSCCPKGVPAFDGVNPRYKRVLWTVIAINGVMFLGEMVAGQIAGSQALNLTESESLSLLKG